MPSSLKSLIARKLKENVPLSDIKKDFREKGYDVESINKAVREAIAGTDKKLPSMTIIQIGVLVVGVMIAIGVAIYVNPDKPSGHNLCDKFSGYDYKISCNRAIELALGNTPGTVQNVSIGSVRTLDVSTEPPSAIVKDMWLIDVKLEKPSFDETFKRQVQTVRIGIGLDENSAIYKEVIK